ncbi:MAG: hypothetical protein Q8O72_10660 [Bacteroidales bacterium]|nr:hypothetical protein [Bacteroidales bacterium]
MLILQCKINIGKYVFNHVNLVTIDSSRANLSDTAVIKLPQKYAGKYLASEINTGDAVEIYLGYKPEMKLEFTGYVSEVNPNIQVEIKCEDSMYKLKQTKPTPLNYTGDLKGLLTRLVPGSTIEVPDMKLTNFKVDGKGSVAYVLQKLKEGFGLDIYFRGTTLFAGLPLTDSKAIADPHVVYNLEKNVINPQLNFRKEADVKLKVKAISILPNNTRLEVETGDADGALRTLHFYNLTTTAELMVQAEQTLKSLKYEGFEGSLMAFGAPYCEHGQIASIVDPRFDSRKGNHYIDRVVVSFGEQGFRRRVFLGRRAS